MTALTSHTQINPVFAFGPVHVNIASMSQSSTQLAFQALFCHYRHTSKSVMFLRGAFHITVLLLHKLIVLWKCYYFSLHFMDCSNFIILCQQKQGKGSKSLVSCIFISVSILLHYTAIHSRQDHLRCHFNKYYLILRYKKC